MAISTEKTGKTIESAIQAALEELNASEEDVVIEVLDEGDSGKILGIGKKDAKVRVTLEEEQAPVYYGDEEDYTGEIQNKQEEAAVNLVTKILSEIGIRADVSSYCEDKTVYINVTGKDVGAAIGRHGETLDSIQYITNIAMNRKSDEYYRLILDIGGYRKKREEKLVSLAKRTASKVTKIKKSYEMEPMNAAERRVVHFALQNFNGVKTFSEGEEPDRCVIISPDKE